MLVTFNICSFPPKRHKRRGEGFNFLISRFSSGLSLWELVDFRAPGKCGLGVGFQVLPHRVCNAARGAGCRGVYLSRHPTAIRKLPVLGSCISRQREVIYIPFRTFRFYFNSYTLQLVQLPAGGKLSSAGSRVQVQCKVLARGLSL